MQFRKFCTSATVFFFILTVVFCNKQCTVQNITGSSFTTNRYMNSYVIREEHNSGPKMCIRDCLLQHGCNAINYNDNKNCELLSTEESDTNSNIDGHHYSSITNWTMVSRYKIEINLLYPCFRSLRYGIFFLLIRCEAIMKPF